MGKGRRNQRNPDYYKVQGGAVEEPAATRAAKQAFATQRTNLPPRKQKRVAPPRPTKPRAKASRQVAKPSAKRVPSVTPPDDGVGLFVPEAPAPRRSLFVDAGHLVGRIATFAIGVARSAIDRIRHRRD